MTKISSHEVKNGVTRINNVKENLRKIREQYEKRGPRNDESSKQLQTNTEKECAICLDTIKPLNKLTLMQRSDDKNGVRLRRCGHEFHERCISEWTKINRTCPTCRKPLLNPFFKFLFKLVG